MDYSNKEDLIEYIFDKAGQFILPSESNGYKSKFLQSKILLYCVVLLLFLRVITSVVTINFPQNIFFADITRATLENFVNQTRQSVGLKPLAENGKLDQAAQMKAQNMLQNNYFDHNSPSGVTPWFWFSQAGYKYKYAGENLAIGFYDSQEVYNAWLNSPSHKANIVNPNYTEIGTAILNGFGGSNTIVVVQEFGSQTPIKVVATTKTNVSKQVATVTTKPIAPKPTATTQVATDVKTNTTQGATTNEKVLSQSTEAQVSIQTPISSGLKNVPAKIMNSLLYNYDSLLQNVIYGVSFIIIGILLTLIFFNFHISFKKQLVFRATLILVLLSLATLLNKENIIAIIPHRIFI